jgi:hypothetical protein
VYVAVPDVLHQNEYAEIITSLGSDGVPVVVTLTDVLVAAVVPPETEPVISGISTLLPNTS